MMGSERFPAPWLALLGASVLAMTPAARAAPDHLPSWSDGPARTRIVQFVEAVTDPLSQSYVPPADRVAMFDNDGTLWSEQPLYSQAMFALDTARAMAAADPAIAVRAPIDAASKDDLKALAEVVALTHADTTSDEFAARVRQWTRTARHPAPQRPYTELTYLPMRELLDYLAANGFSTWIVSGGGVEFMRVFSQEIYGIPPERVIGSSIKTRYELRDGKPVIVRLLELKFAYDRGSHVGKLERGLDEAATRGWTVISMKDAWKQVYAPAR